MPVPTDGQALIHAQDGTVGKHIAYSACGVVTEVSHGLRTAYKGSRVAVFGIADCPHSTEYIVAEEQCILITDTCAKTAALVGVGACYVNVAKLFKMPLGSKVCVDCGGLPLLGPVLEAIGYSYSDIPDYTITDEVIKKLGGISPGADWMDESVSVGKRIYPYAYIHNTTKANVSTFLDAIQSGKLNAEIFKTQYEIIALSSEQVDQTEEDIKYTAEDLAAGFAFVDAAKHASYTEAIGKNSAVIYSDAVGRLGSYAGDFMGRSMPAIVMRICPAGEDADQMMFEKLAELNEWIRSAPSSSARVADGVVTVGYRDGSHATVHLVPGAALEHSELHWEGKSIIIDGDTVIGYSCAGNLPPPAYKPRASCLKARAELFSSLFGGRNH